MPFDCLKVNADYESVLFHARPGPVIMNQTLEYLPFFLEELPVLTSKSYTQEYLSFVESVSGRIPRTVTSGNYLNWWGPLLNLPEERRLNSKVTSFHLALKNGWTKGQVVSRKEFQILTFDKRMLIKDPYGMSGKGLEVLEPGEHFRKPGNPDDIFLIEPLLERSYDFSHYVFPDGTFVGYENMVDERFQYRGTRFPLIKKADITSFSFYKEVSPSEWEKFQSRLKEIISHFGTGHKTGYSIDSFIYLEDGELKIHALSEINARRTMGLTAWELCSRYCGEDGAGSLTLNMKEGKRSLKLSPEGVRFDLYLNFY